MLPEISILRLSFMIMEKSDSTRISKRAFIHSYGWRPRPQLRRPTTVLVIKCPTLLTCIENSYLTTTLCQSVLNFKFLVFSTYIFSCS
jgi:hypothetical protein